MHELGIDAERRGHLARVEDAEPAARPGTDVTQAAARGERVHRDIDGTLDLRDGLADGGGDGRVLVVQELEDRPRGHGAELRRARIARLGDAFAHRGPQASRIARRAAPIAGSSRTGSTVALGSIARSSTRTARSSEGSVSNAPPAR